MLMLPPPALPSPCQPSKVPAAVPQVTQDAGKVQPDAGAGSPPPAVTSPLTQWWQWIVKQLWQWWQGITKQLWQWWW